MRFGGVVVNVVALVSHYIVVFEKLLIISFNNEKEENCVYLINRNNI